MTLVKLNPNRQNLFPAFSGILDDFFKEEHFLERAAVGTAPAVNIREFDASFEIELAAPGMQKENFNLEVEKNQLKISATREEKKVEDKKGGKFSLREFNYHSFERSFNLPETINIDKIGAEYKDGILKLTLPKKEEAKQLAARTIKIS